MKLNPACVLAIYHDMGYQDAATVDIGHMRSVFMLYLEQARPLDKLDLQQAATCCATAKKLCIASCHMVHRRLTIRLPENLVEIVLCVTASIEHKLCHHNGTTIVDSPIC